MVPTRHGSSAAYRYGFNGKENDNEVMGEGNFQDYGMRMYNPRLGRFFNVDPLTSEYPELTPYQFASNTPMWAIDIDGLEGGISNIMGNSSVSDLGYKGNNNTKTWFSQPASRWMKLGLACQMNAILTDPVYNENSFPGMTKGQYLVASMAQAQINHNSTGPQFVSGKRTKLPQQPHTEVETPKQKPKQKVSVDIDNEPTIKVNKIQALSKREIAEKFLKNNLGKEGIEAQGVINTINFNKSVSKVVIKTGDRVWRFVTPGQENDPNQHFFTDAHGADAGPSGVGLTNGNKILIEYEATSNTTVLKTSIKGTNQVQYISSDLQNNLKEIKRE